MIRPFELRDIATLYRYRHNSLFLDSMTPLLWGRTLIPARAIFSPVAGALGVFTSVYQDQEANHEIVIAQVAHVTHSRFARFTFITPDAAIESPALTELVEQLVAHIGQRGAHNLIAEVDEKTRTFEALRQASFSIYSRQHIWRIADKPEKGNEASPWRPVTSADEFNVRKLYNALVPSLVQQAEPPPWENLRGWVYYDNDELLAFADTTTGPLGLWVQPFIHPEMQAVNLRLRQLFNHIPLRNNHPAFVCLRSYQAWLQNTLEDLGAESSPAQAVMVRRTVTSIQKPATAPLPTLNGNTKPTTTFYKNPDSKQRRTN